MGADWKYLPHTQIYSIFWIVKIGVDITLGVRGNRHCCVCLSLSLCEDVGPGRGTSLMGLLCTHPNVWGLFVRVSAYDPVLLWGGGGL
jgi:hypothetical protein